MPGEPAKPNEDLAPLKHDAEWREEIRRRRESPDEDWLDADEARRRRHAKYFQRDA